jgi:hypothetical protein
VKVHSFEKIRGVCTPPPQAPPSTFVLENMPLTRSYSSISTTSTLSIVTAITIEPGQDRNGNVRVPANDDDYIIPKPIRGILTNQGYAMPDPNVPDRLSIWFSGGALEVQDEPRDLDEWKKVFDADFAPDRNLREYANILAAKFLIGALLPEGMEDDGTVSFTLKRPIGGHGLAYVDVVYMDADLRIMRGHHGSVYVCTRVPEPDRIYV